MRKFWKATCAFLGHEEGATMVEYAIMLALISVICLAAVTSTGTGSKTNFNKIAASL
ncbi:MAG TPA: Flp family type IVb pilin [Isosphaeraceae bacterium]|jgi:pilus assembly protein Flp/PilA|nr:Flp family type IVb pilin [Isosphaeraceae bacterium]